MEPYCPSFVGVAVSTFVIGVWAARGFPMRSPFTSPAKPMAATVDATFGNDKTEQVRERRTQEAINDPDNAKRNPLRMEALQAATG